MMRLPFLEFKEMFCDPSQSWWKRAYQICSQQWAMFRGTDYDTQQHIVKENEKQSNDAVEKIKVCSLFV